MSQASFLARCPDCRTMLKVFDIFEDQECPVCSATVTIQVNNTLNPHESGELRQLKP